MFANLEDAVLWDDMGTVQFYKFFSVVNFRISDSLVL